VPAPCGAGGFRLERIGVVAVKEMAQKNSCQGQEHEYKALESNSVACLSVTREGRICVSVV
jgi:hypothetical protein